MTTIMTLNDLESVLIELATAESAALFAQGDALVLACEPETRARLGMASDAAVLEFAGSAIGRGRRTMYNRLKVARTFAPDERIETLTWSTHLTAANSSSPHLWLQRAAAEQWTHTQLDAAIAAAREGDPDETETVIIVRARQAVVHWHNGVCMFELVADAADVDARDGEACVITVAIDRPLTDGVQQYAHEQEAA
jgi:hypothetical protein